MIKTWKEIRNLKNLVIELQKVMKKKKLSAQKRLGGAAALLLLCTSGHWSHYVNGSGEERSYYKQYANLLTKIKSAAKKSYYGTQLKLHSNNPAKMRKTLRELLLSKKQHSDVPISIKINDAIFSDLEQVTHAFNDLLMLEVIQRKIQVQITLTHTF